MQEFLHSVSAVGLILVMVAIGYIFGRLGWMNAKVKPFIIKFLMNVAVPCLCIKNLLGDISRDMLAGTGLLLVAAFVTVAVTVALSLLFAKLLKIDHARFGGFVVMCAFANSIFVGLPMCTQLFGDAAVPYVMLFYMVNTTLFWTVGEMLIRRSGESADTKFSLKRSLKGLLTAPLITLIAGMILLSFGVRTPDLVLTLCGYMSSSVTPLALLYVGYVIYETGFGNIRFGWDMAAMMFLRFVVGPACIILLFRLFGLGEGMPRSVFVIESAMPVMVQSVVVAGSVGADDSYNAVGMTLTTLASFIVVPVLMLIV